MMNSSPKIILAMPNRLGDTMFRLPLLSLLKRVFPDSMIDVVAPTALSSGVLEHNPMIQQIILLSNSPLISQSSSYDFGIDVTDSTEAREKLKSIPIKQIFRYQTDPTCKNKHMVERLLIFLANCFQYDLSHYHPPYQLFPQKKHFEKIRSLLQIDDSSKKKTNWIGFHLGCHGLAKKRTRIFKRHLHSKAWPLKKFIKLAETLQHLYPSTRIVLTGVKEEEKIVKLFCKKIKQALNLINKINILELAALMDQLDLFVTNDTGPLHVACATNVNLIVLFGKTDVVLNGPYPQKNNRIVLQKSDISAIEVTDVLKCLRILKRVDSIKLRKIN